MLALVHPFTHSTTDGPHRQPRKPTHQHHASSSSSTSAVSSSTPTASRTPSVPAPAVAALDPHPPQLQRIQTAPAPSAVTFQLPRPAPHSHRSSPPVRIHRAATPTPPPAPAPAPAPATANQPDDPPPVDIHSYPATDLLKLLASLLTQIAATNDHLTPSPVSPVEHHPHPHLVQNPLHPHGHPPIWRTLTAASRIAIFTPASSLTFHARNIPTISLEAYLLRILKYCPTTNHVFLSLLVYFDRMSKLSMDATGRSFVIDSYNIHRLVIAGITVASKFFSDVFYTNSRYAKVGGLPLPELNQLELQFLLLNDFRLVISSAEMQRYAEQLILFSKSQQAESSSSAAAASSSSSTAIPHTLSSKSTSTNGHAHAATTSAMKSMGAIDAYGGKVVGSEEAQKRPAPPVVANGHHHGLVHQEEEDAGTETETETETDADDGNSIMTDASTTTDGDDTTDDEPTVRPAYSRVSSSGSGGRSVSESESGCEEDDEGMEGVQGQGGQKGLVEGEGDDGERTPERVGRGVGVGVGVGDERMRSP